MNIAIYYTNILYAYMYIILYNFPTIICLYGFNICISSYPNNVNTSIQSYKICHLVEKNKKKTILPG